ncbi:MAG: hypothetical protein GOU98_01060 [Candidatus Altiarchaeota archaeon]|nr:hypothetical protein [Candidatus Altiarchaeota archaeon]
MVWGKIIATLMMGLVPIKAHCPLCTAAAGAGVAITRFYGVDDIIVGFWLGALLVSTALWFNKSLKREYIKGQEAIIVLLTILSLVIPLYGAGFIGGSKHAIYMMMPSGSLFGIDRLLLGILVGGSLLVGAMKVSTIVKQKKGLLFPYQTIVFIILSLLVSSIITWGILK